MKDQKLRLECLHLAIAVIDQNNISQELLMNAAKEIYKWCKDNDYCAPADSRIKKVIN